MADMFFYILDYQFDVIGVVDSYKSAIWTERFYTAGDFEIYVPDTTYYNDLLRLPADGHSIYILRADDQDKLGIIEKIQYKDDPDNGKMILVTGHTDDYFLHYRLLMEQATYNGNLELAVRHMITNAFISSEFNYSRRVTNKMSLGAKIGLLDTVQLQYQGQYLDEEVDKLAKEYGFGYKMDYDPEFKHFTFSLLASVDRSLDQLTNDPVVFSAKLDNLSSSEYDRGVAYNAAYAYGDGSGSFKYSNGYTLPASVNFPLERKEAHVDASTTSNNGEAMDGWVLSNLLEQEAKSMVTRSQNSTETVTAEVLANTNFVLGVDYFLGDIVQVVIECGDDRSVTRSFKQKVTEVIESFDDTGYQCIPTFETVTI